METEVGLSLLTRRCFLSEFVQDSRHRHVRFRICGVDARSFAKFLQSLFRLLTVFQNRSKLEMRFGERGIQAQSLAQIPLCLVEAIQELQSNGKIQVGPWRRVLRSAPELDRLLIVLHRQFVLVLVVIAKPQVVIRTGHLGSNSMVC